MPSAFSQIRHFIAGLTSRGNLSDGAGRMVEREARQAVHGAVIYRPKDGLVWYEGALVDLSLTGILFRGEKQLPTDSPVELSFTVQPLTGRKALAPVFCWGKVARSAPPGINDARPAVAVQVLRYRGGPQAAREVRGLVGDVRGPMSA